MAQKRQNKFAAAYKELDPNDPSILTMAGRTDIVESEPEVETEPEKPAIQEETKAAEDLLRGLGGVKPKAKSYSFHLRDDVVDALDKLAKKNKTSRSNVLNTLLQNYFGI